MLAKPPSRVYVRIECVSFPLVSYAPHLMGMRMTDRPVKDFRARRLIP